MASFKNVDAAVLKLAQHNLSFALKAMGGEVKQGDAAKLLGCGASTISEYKDDSLERACQMLAAFNIKLVHKDEKTFAPDLIAAYRTLARQGMDRDPDSGWGTL